MIGLVQGKVSLCLINASDWKIIFDEEKTKLSKALENSFIAIEHVGSTAIPGIMAKPIIDIAVGIKHIEEGIFLKEVLETGGYIYRPENSNSERLFFIKTIQNRRTHHLHVEEFGENSWNNHIYFRDFLLESPELRIAYVELKRSLAQKYPDDRKKYTDKKAIFIQKAISLYKLKKCE